MSALITRQRFAGNFTLKGSGEITGHDFDGNVTIEDAPNLGLTNCRIRGDLTVKRSPGFHAFDLEVTGSKQGRPLVWILDSDDWVIKRATICPATPTVGQNGLQTNSRGFISEADISKTVDGVVLYGGAVTVENSIIHDLITYDTDPAQGGKPSHSDGVQIQAGLGHRFINCDIDGGKNAAMMITQDVGPVGDLLVRGCTLGGGQVSVNFKTNKNAAAYSGPVAIKDTRFRRTQTGGFKYGGAILRNPDFVPLTLEAVTWTDTGATVVADRGA